MVYHDDRGFPHCECHDIAYGSKKGAKICEQDNLEEGQE